jgi:hypothetical protein
MSGLSLDPRLVSVAIMELPNAIAFIRDAFQKDHPDVPAPTDADVIAAYQSALASSLAKDAAWLAAHPE